MDPRKNYLYQPDKKQVYQMKKSVNDFKKRLPNDSEVKELIVSKKKVHR